MGRANDDIDSVLEWFGSDGSPGGSAHDDDGAAGHGVKVGHIFGTLPGDFALVADSTGWGRGDDNVHHNNLLLIFRQLNDLIGNRDI